MKPTKTARKNAPNEVSSPHRQARFRARQPILDAGQNIVAYEQPLREPVREALLGNENETGTGLRIMKSYDTGAMDGSLASIKRLNLSPEILNSLCIDAARWAEIALKTHSA